jgi:hypothetical protein
MRPVALADAAGCCSVDYLALICQSVLLWRSFDGVPSCVYGRNSMFVII